MENLLNKQQSVIQESAVIRFYNMFSIDFARQIGVPGCVQILLALEPKPMVNGGYPGASSSDRPRVRADTMGFEPEANRKWRVPWCV